MLGLMTVKAHEAAVDVLISDRAKALVEAQQERETSGRLLGKNVALRSEVAELRTELADLKAKRARSSANLIPGGAKNKAQVLAERAGRVG